jgi:parallel beta-helix repeat protein
MGIFKRFQGLVYLMPILMPIAFSSVITAIPAIAQTLPQTSEPQNIIYVNPQTGSDRPDQGSSNAPFKTISYAISRAQPEATTIIQLANGVYSSNSGEQFPIRLRSNVTLRGNEADKGRGIAIVGGGTLLSISRLTQNVAIALADRSELRGVTVTNPNSRGYGLWVENASPAIVNNTLLDNHQDGMLITGKSTALVSANQFFRNGTSGLAIEGTASPEIRSNLFQQTTFGMSIRQEATPQITENTFTQNQNGILIQASAKPILRGNMILNNRNYGLTVSDNANPDLGKTNDDGNNTFVGNGTFDLQNVSSHAIAVIGNQLDITRAKGKLQLSNVRSPNNSIINGLIASPPSSASRTNASPTNTLSTNRFANINQQLQEQLVASQNVNLAPTQTNGTNQINNSFWYESVNSVIIRIEPKRIDSPIPANPEITANLRPVRAFPPSGEPVNQPIQIAPLSNTSMVPQTPPRYRVVVPVSSPNSVAQVRQLVPNSFASRLNGVLVVQIGAYSDRSVAESQVSRLLQQGLSARIESINR